MKKTLTLLSLLFCLINISFSQVLDDADTSFVAMKPEIYLRTKTIGTVFPHAFFIGNNKFSLDNNSWDNVGILGNNLKPHLEDNINAALELKRYRNTKIIGLLTQWGATSSLWIASAAIGGPTDSDAGLVLFLSGHGTWIMGNVISHVIARPRLKKSVEIFNSNR